mmetsp:Transcript_156201/g.277110  ORF Transcript_156201/g.277110 Transcript_156201/m.277110 type:complete len:689 (+) Transcript_156201:62-2128(+)
MLFLSLLAAAAFIAEGAASVCEVPKPAEKCSNHVLLQQSNNVFREVSPTVPEQFLEEEALAASVALNSGEADSAKQASEVFADAVDPSCTPGLGCNLKDSISPNRSVLCVRSSERHECWDVCNTRHSPEDYQTGNILMDLEIQKSVKDARAGAFETIKCPSKLVVTLPEASKVADVITTPATEAAAAGPSSRPAPPAEQATPGAPGAAAEKLLDMSNAIDKSVGTSDAGTSYASVSDSDAEVVATTAEFDEAGYTEVAALGKHKAMVAYIRRVVRNLGCRITDEARLEGIVPFYSGENTTQSFAALEGELVHACLTGTDSWLESMPAVLERKQREVPGISLGMTASFDEDGYKSVAALKDEKQMEMYIRRVITDLLGGFVREEGDLKGLVPYYAGTKSTQSFTALVKEVMSEMFRPGGWAVHPETKILHKNKVVVEGAVLAKETDTPTDVAAGPGPKAPAVPAASSFADCPFNATQAKENVPLDEQGYSALLELSNNCAMKQFMHRVVESVGCKVTDEAGMKGLVPYYSGTKGSASYEELAQDLTEKCENDAELWLGPISAAKAAKSTASRNFSASEAVPGQVADVLYKASAADAAKSPASRDFAKSEPVPGRVADAFSKASQEDVPTKKMKAVLTQASSTLHHRASAETAAPAAANRKKEAATAGAVVGGDGRQKKEWGCIGRFCLR